MHIGLVLLGGKTRDMIYIELGTHHMIPLVEYDSETPLCVATEHKIIDMFELRTLIPGSTTKILICEWTRDATPYITYANPRGFVIADLLFSRELADKFTQEEKNRIRRCISHIDKSPITCHQGALS